jgi:hypothetical protein
MSAAQTVAVTEASEAAATVGTVVVTAGVAAAAATVAGTAAAGAVLKPKFVKLTLNRGGFGAKLAATPMSGFGTLAMDGGDIAGGLGILSKLYTSLRLI